MSPSNRDTKLHPGLVVGGVLAGAVLVTGLVVFGGVACSTDQVRRGLSGASSDSPDAVLAQLKDEKSKIDQVSDDMMQQIKSFNESRKPGERTLTFGEVFHGDFSSEEQDVLNSMLEQEKDVSYKALLQKLIEDRNLVQGLQEKVLHLEQNLPDKFVVAKKGDSQYDLAMAYLTDQAGVEQDKAKMLLADVDLSDTLLPGNKVWFFYDPARDSFRTYITRGDAGQTPLAIRRAMQRKLISERDAALTRASSLEEEQAGLQAQVEGLNNQVQSLDQRKQALEADISSLEESKADLKERVAGLSTDLATRENSLYYHVASEKDLRSQGNVSFFTRRFRDAKGVPYDQSIDLRTGSSIVVTAEDLGLDKIKHVRLLPDIYQIDRDYTVEPSEDGASAKVNILDRGLFRGKEVLLSIRG